MKSIRFLFCVLTFALISVTCAYTHASLHSATSSVGSRYAEYLDQYDGMQEEGYNQGPYINQANRHYAYIRAPYCASCQSESIDGFNREQTCSTDRITLGVRSARARDFITDASIDARQVWLGKITVPDNSLVIYVRKGGGHISYNAEGRQFHFNSSPPRSYGSMWNGRWSGWKSENLIRQCSPLNTFRITHFTILI